jgi:DNA invertase Pin-like site-specific DNA recombinase
MLIGYERVSTDDQNLALQHDALQAAGCSKIFSDKISGAKADRPGLKKALDFARAGDTLVVWRLDRLGRSLKDLIALVEELETGKIGFRSLQENIDTTTSGGKLIFHLFGALAEFERNLIRERTQAGLQAARARGRKGGRRPKLTAQQIEIGRSLAADPKRSVTSICDHLGLVVQLTTATSILRLGQSEVSSGWSPQICTTLSIAANDSCKESWGIWRITGIVVSEIVFNRK